MCTYIDTCASESEFLLEQATKIFSTFTGSSEFCGMNWKPVREAYLKYPQSFSQGISRNIKAQSDMRHNNVWLVRSPTSQECGSRWRAGWLRRMLMMLTMAITVAMVTMVIMVV